MERKMKEFTATNKNGEKVVVFDGRLEEHSPHIAIEHEHDGEKHTVIIPFGAGARSADAQVADVYAIKEVDGYIMPHSEPHFDKLIEILRNAKKIIVPKGFKGEGKNHANKLVGILERAKAAYVVKQAVKARKRN